MTINELIASDQPAEEKIKALQNTPKNIPSWSALKKEYDPAEHQVNDHAEYPDIVGNDRVEKVTRVALDLQRLAVKRMTELVTGIQPKRVYNPHNDKQKEIQAFIESIFARARIDSVNNERCTMLYGGCEAMTLWYAVENQAKIYTIPTRWKLRCRNFSQMQGDTIYPLFDEYGDMQAISVGYSRVVGGNRINYFDAYTSDYVVKWSDEGGAWAERSRVKTTVGKIPAIYISRPTPVWEKTSPLVAEMEWALSRNGNYLRRNSKPIFGVFADGDIKFGGEDTSAGASRNILQLPRDSSAQYITWPQAIDNLKYYVDTLRDLFFTQLQLPDWSYGKMSQQALSGESRKQMFIDAQLKVKDEAGRLIEAFDREVNVIKAFAKTALPESYHDDVDALEVESVITPFTINDDKDTINNLMTANGGLPIMSQRESIEQYGQSSDVDRTMAEIAKQETANIFEPTE